MCVANQEKREAKSGPKPGRDPGPGYIVPLSSVSAVPEHSPERPGEAAERPSPWGLAGVALVAALLQVVASIALGMARSDDFARAAAEDPRVYLVVAALLTAAVYSVWLVRERVPVALTLAVAWPVGMAFGLRGHASGLGLAFHGEFILHHFSALLCLILAVSVPFNWARDRRLGRLRWLPAALALPGAALLATAHLASASLPVDPEWLAEAWVATTGGALLLAAWPLAVALFWRDLGPKQRRPIALILLVPVLVRLGFSGPHGLSGELVGDAAIPWLGAAIIAAAIATLLLLRPRVDLWVTVLVGAICLLGSAFFFWLYEHGFGELEDGLGGLLQSLFGFQLPYPSYVDTAKAAALMTGLFFIFVTVYSALVSTEDRIRGIALGLMMIAGLGFSSPHLVLMLGVGATLFIETLLPGAPYRELRRDGLLDFAVPSDPDAAAAVGSSLQACFESLAERLHLEPPMQVQTDRGSLVAMHGELDGLPVDLRGRIERSGPRVEIILGVPGDGDPEFELIPDRGQRGQRPAHLLSRSHRVAGDVRALEVFGDAPLDALSSFPTAYLRAWPAGVEVELGRDLAGLRVDNLEALVRGVTRSLSKS